jgi:hypothetical protein
MDVDAFIADDVDSVGGKLYTQGPRGMLSARKPCLHAITGSPSG